MLHPNQYQVNEAWIAFKLNDEPIHTELDGDFDFLALMDAASCFILSYVPVAAKAAEPTQMESRRLLKEGKSQKMQLPNTLFVPIEQSAHFLVAEAERVGIEVVRVEEHQLLIFIGEAREGFRERFGGGGGARRIVGVNCLWFGNPAMQASEQLLICMPYVNFGVRNCPIDRIRRYPNPVSILLKGVSGPSGHTYIAERIGNHHNAAARTQSGFAPCLTKMIDLQ